MILTITPSPAIDWTIELEKMNLGEVNRGLSAAKEASGKGVNVSLALLSAGVETAAILPVGGDSGKFMLDSLSARGLRVFATHLATETRTNVTLSLHDMGDTKVNTESGSISETEIGALLDLLEQNIETADVLVSCGSLPSGASSDLHKDILDIGKRAGKTCVLDASGLALEKALPAKPDLIKPNLHELAELADSSIETFGDVEQACKKIIEEGVGSVLASLGSDGALFVNSQVSILGGVSGVEVKNTVGSGDALLAGFLEGYSSPNLDYPERLSTALVWASSSVQSSTTSFEIDRAFESETTVSEDFDREQVLSATVQPGRARI